MSPNVSWTKMHRSLVSRASLFPQTSGHSVCCLQQLLPRWCARTQDTQKSCYWSYFTHPVIEPEIFQGTFSKGFWRTLLSNLSFQIRKQAHSYRTAHARLCGRAGSMLCTIRNKLWNQKRSSYRVRRQAKNGPHPSAANTGLAKYSKGGLVKEKKVHQGHLEAVCVCAYVSGQMSGSILKCHFLVLSIEQNTPGILFA